MHFFDKMLAVVKRTFPDQDAAISILNNGFLRAFAKIGQYSGSGSFEGWLRRIIHHAAADYFREHRRQLETAPLPPHLPLADGHDQAAYKELLQLLHYLPPATRMVINLFIIEGYSHKEVGAMLGISTGTSKWHVSEGKRLLKVLLNQQYERTRTGY